ncbi:hypothetical protein GIB67_027125 [Kingdonia uniflora]|uniref:Uncharacterized protein n=1 Tax=Kingdonia uniflora TaxID=39325 RepID=A0A7J7P273_9MAGN|nr:hypothetical protein GIB67_027125 [Kingdonia uniflora]
MPEGDPHPSTLLGFRGTRDPERFVTRSRSGRKKKRVEFEDVQPQDIPNPTEDNFPRRCITQLPDRVSHIYYTGKELTNRDSMRVHDTFTTMFKVWKDIATLPVYWFYEYCGVGRPIVKKEVTGEVGIPLDPPLSMSPHISPAALHEMRQAGFVDFEQFVVGEVRKTYASYWVEQISEVGHMLIDSQRMGNLDMFRLSALIAESARDAQRIQEVEEELAIARRKIDSIDHQLYAHKLYFDYVDDSE